MNSKNFLPFKENIIQLEFLFFKILFLTNYEKKIFFYKFSSLNFGNLKNDFSECFEFAKLHKSKKNKK